MKELILSIIITFSLTIFLLLGMGFNNPFNQLLKNSFSPAGQCDIPNPGLPPYDPANKLFCHCSEQR